MRHSDPLSLQYQQSLRNPMIWIANMFDDML